MRRKWRGLRWRIGGMGCSWDGGLGGEEYADVVFFVTYLDDGEFQLRFLGVASGIVVDQ